MGDAEHERSAFGVVPPSGGLSDGPHEHGGISGEGIEMIFQIILIVPAVERSIEDLRTADDAKSFRCGLVFRRDRESIGGFRGGRLEREAYSQEQQYGSHESGTRNLRTQQKKLSGEVSDKEERSANFLKREGSG